MRGSEKTVWVEVGPFPAKVLWFEWRQLKPYPGQVSLSTILSSIKIRAGIRSRFSELQLIRYFVNLARVHSIHMATFPRGHVSKRVDYASVGVDATHDANSTRVWLMRGCAVTAADNTSILLALT